MRACIAALTFLCAGSGASLAWDPTIRVGEPRAAPPLHDPLPLGVARDVCYAVPMNPDGLWISSEVVVGVLESEIADDFLLAENREIIHARWWGSFRDDIPWDDLIDPFNLRLYEDDNCLPGALLLELIVPGDCNQTQIGVNQYGWPLYEYDVGVSFSALGGERYWFSAQGVHESQPQWGRHSGIGIFGCQAAFRSEYFGFPNWVPVQVLGVPELDMGVELECVEPTATVETTWGAVKGLFEEVH